MSPRRQLCVAEKAPKPREFVTPLPKFYKSVKTGFCKSKWEEIPIDQETILDIHAQIGSDRETTLAHIIVVEPIPDFDPDTKGYAVAIDSHWAGDLALQEVAFIHDESGTMAISYKFWN